MVLSMWIKIPDGFKMAEGTKRRDALARRADLASYFLFPDSIPSLGLRRGDPAVPLVDCNDVSDILTSIE